VSFPIGILDQSPVVAGATPREAILATIALARAADGLGYTRYWLAEHHAMQGLADASPEILLARLSAETSRIRLGTGGIMLPHYSAFKVAETFRMLDALAPGRIDLGVGRAPGGVGLVNVALESGDPREFPDQIAQTIGFMEDAMPLRAMPSGATAPQVWVLGSSEYSALLAAEMGLPYAYAHFIGGDATHITRAYRARFKPNARTPEPRCIIAAAVISADSDAQAQELALPLRLWRSRILRGQAGPIPSLEEAKAYRWSAQERAEAERSRRLLCGTPSAVRGALEGLIEEHAADEAMLVTIAPDYASRLHSYELLAREFALDATFANAL
jgi:luciferase family oxidoreductase group 1